MALIPQAIEDRIKALEDTVAYLEDKTALLEEALAPRIVEPEVHDAMMRGVYSFEEIEDVDSNIG